MTMYEDDVDEGVASKGVPCRDKDRGRAAAPAIAPAGVEIVFLEEWAAAVEGATGVPAGRLSLTDRYLHQKRDRIRDTRHSPQATDGSLLQERLSLYLRGLADR